MILFSQGKIYATFFTYTKILLNYLQKSYTSEARDVLYICLICHIVLSCEYLKKQTMSSFKIALNIANYIRAAIGTSYL